MTPGLARAIKLISPHCNFRPVGASRAVWEADQNGACWAEYEALRDTLAGMPKPARVLEIGPGMGRSLVFFSKKLGWENIELHAYEGDGKTTKYTRDGPRFEDSFCGTISELQNVLHFNGIMNVTIHDAKKKAMRELPGPFDLVYGFYTIGYHWSLKYFLDEVLALIDDRGRAIFTVQADFKPFDELYEKATFKVINKEKVWPPGEWAKLIILSKKH
jgi:hypothetical protein